MSEYDLLPVSFLRKEEERFSGYPTNEGYVRKDDKGTEARRYISGTRIDPRLEEMIPAPAEVERSIRNAVQLLPEIHASKNLEEGVYYNSYLTINNSETGGGYLLFGII